MYTEGQMRQALRLGTRLRDEPGGPLGRRRELLRGLCEMAGAIAGFSALLTDDFLLAEPVAVTIPDSGETIDPQRVGSHFISPISPLAIPFVRGFAKNGMEPTSMVRRDLVEDRAWYTSTYYRDRRRATGYDDILLSAIALPGQVPAMAVVGLSRPVGRTTGFGERDAAWVNLLHSELRWTYELKSTGSVEPRMPPMAPVGRMVNLSPRLQRVLHCLLEGHREKEVARILAISHHTVHQYVKMLYKEMNVGSRAELLALWIQSDSGPAPRNWEAFGRQ